MADSITEGGDTFNKETQGPQSPNGNGQAQTSGLKPPYYLSRCPLCGLPGEELFQQSHGLSLDWSCPSCNRAYIFWTPTPDDVSPTIKRDRKPPRGTTFQNLAAEYRALQDDAEGHVSDPIWRANLVSTRELAAEHGPKGQALLLPDLLPANDSGNAQRFANSFGGSVRYVTDVNRWLIRTDGYWPWDEAGTVVEYAKQASVRILSLADGIEDDKEARSVLNFGIQSGNNGKITAMLELVQTILPIHSRDLDADKWLFNARNKTIDLKTGEGRPFNPGDFITKRGPIEYDQEAKCPEWEAWIDLITQGDKDKARFLQQAFGSSLTGDTGEQCVFFLYGQGANGKTVLIETIRAIMGPYAENAAPESFLAGNTRSIRSDLAALRGARFVTTSEADTEVEISEGIIKRITGGDPITAEYKFKDQFTFTPQFKLWWLMNHKPEVKGMDHGFWRRIRLVHLGHVFQEGRRSWQTVRDEFVSKEGPGILAWLVRGCLYWQAHSLIRQPPPIIQEAIDEYKQEMNPLSDFLEVCEQGKDFYIRPQEAYNHYQLVASTRGGYALGPRKFYQKLQDLGFRPAKVNGDRRYVGLRLKNKPDDESRMTQQQALVAPVLGSSPATAPEAQDGAIKLQTMFPPEPYGLHPEERRTRLLRTIARLAEERVPPTKENLLAQGEAAGAKLSTLDRDLDVLRERGRISWSGTSALPT